MKLLKLDMLNEGDYVEFITIIDSVSFGTSKNKKPFVHMVARTTDKTPVSLYMFNVDFQRETVGIDFKLLVDKAVECRGNVTDYNGNLNVVLEQVKAVSLSPLHRLKFEPEREDYIKYKTLLDKYTSDSILTNVKYISGDGVKLPYFYIAYDVFNNMELLNSAGISEEEVTQFTVEYGRYFYAMNSIGDVRLPSIDRDFIGGIESESEIVVDVLMALCNGVEPRTSKGMVLWNVLNMSIANRLMITTTIKDFRKGIVLNNKLNL